MIYNMRFRKEELYTRLKYTKKLFLSPPVVINTALSSISGTFFYLTGDPLISTIIYSLGGLTLVTAGLEGCFAKKEMIDCVNRLEKIVEDKG